MIDQQIDYITPSDRHQRLIIEKRIYEECHSSVLELEGKLRTLGFINTLDTEAPIAAISQLHTYFCWRVPQCWNVGTPKRKKKSSRARSVSRRRSRKK